MNHDTLRVIKSQLASCPNSSLQHASPSSDYLYTSNRNKYVPLPQTNIFGRSEYPQDVEHDVSPHDAGRHPRAPAPRSRFGDPRLPQPHQPRPCPYAGIYHFALPQAHASHADAATGLHHPALSPASHNQQDDDLHDADDSDVARRNRNRNRNRNQNPDAPVHSRPPPSRRRRSHNPHLLARSQPPQQHLRPLVLRPAHVKPLPPPQPTVSPWPPPCARKKATSSPAASPTRRPSSASRRKEAASSASGPRLRPTSTRSSVRSTPPRFSTTPSGTYRRLRAARRPGMGRDGRRACGRQRRDGVRAWRRREAGAGLGRLCCWTGMACWARGCACCCAGCGLRDGDGALGCCCDAGVAGGVALAFEHLSISASRGHRGHRGHRR